jgi:hypothetical protein
MKKLVILMLALASFQMTALAQPKGEGKAKKEKIQEMKIAYITKELDLSATEAEKFWPVYNEMGKKVKESRKAKRELIKDLNTNLETLSEAEVKTKVDAIQQKESDELKLKKEYGDKIGGIIGYKKAVKLVSLERKFKEELLKELKKRQENNGGHNRPPAPPPHGPRPE